jgi:ATP-binding cassette, subfamily B, multidrug efflux pump
MSNSPMKDEFQVQSRKFQFFRLMSYFKPYSGMVVVSVFLAFLISASVLIKPYIIKSIIDGYIVTDTRNMEGLRMMGFIYFQVVVLGAAFGYAQTMLLTYVGQKIMFAIRNQLFAHIQRMSMVFFDRNSTGRILTRVTNDVEALNELYSGVIVNMFRDSIMLVGIIAMMFALDVKLALISIGSVPVIIAITVIYRIAARKNFVRMKGMLAKINGFLAENISGMKLVQIFRREREKHKELLQLDGEYFSTSLREVVLNSLGRPLVDIVNNLTIAVLLWFCSGRILGGVLEIGVLYAFITYARQFFEPISEISEKYTSIQSAVVSSERIFEILDTTEFQEDLEQGRSIDSLKGEIEFRNVWFAYQGEDWVLKDVSFHIMPGECAAFVGSTGSGKSTVISLIARFYDIQKGQILIDGADIREYNLRDLRRQIAVVLQDVFLFSGDIRSNIRLNNREISDMDIEAAAKFVSADRFIDTLPSGYTEEVKERGCTFSAGQRQLVSFARAVAFQPSILVLDEATASIDTETEIAIQKAMTRMAEGRTTIMIAHRLSTIRNSDKIMVLHKGRIKEAGKHEELLERKGIYYQLYQIQAASAAEAAG